MGSIRKMAAFVIVLAFALAALPVNAEEIESKIAHGGRLYDDWINITDGDSPSMRTNPNYPVDKGKMRKAKTWLCVECHGFDYKGKDGAYAKGRHFTGVKGISGSMGVDPHEIIKTLKDKTHGLTEGMIKVNELYNLALFVSKGQLDVYKYIDPKTNTIKGDKAKGAGYFNTICVICHGMDGNKIDEMPSSVGEIARERPWEALHKMLNGQPGKKMPSLRAIPLHISLDILAYAQTLEK